MHKVLGVLGLSVVIAVAACGLDDPPPRYGGARGDVSGSIAALRREAEAGQALEPDRARSVALATLWGALRSPSAEARTAAIEVVEREEIETLAEAVAERMGDDVELVQVTAAAALLRSHPDAPTVVGDALTSSDPEVRRIAVSALGRKLAKEAAATVAPLAKDPDPRVRAAVLAALPPAVVADLARAALADADGAVRAAAVRALGRAGSARVVELAPALQRMLADPYLGARLAALDALAPRLATATLTQLVPQLEAYVRLRAGVILARRGETAAGAAAIDAAGRSPEWPVRSAALNALADVDPRRAAEFAAAFARDPVPEVRLAAARALARLGQANPSRELLATLLASTVSLEAALELARLRDVRGPQTLRARYAAGDAAVRITILREASVRPDADAVLLEGAADPSPLARVIAAELLWRRAR